MDIIREIKEKMEEQGITEKILSDLTGIEEYNIYYLLTYQQYISKIAVIVFNTVLSLGNNGYTVNEIVEANKKKVGAPETNLEIAHKMVDPEYVEMLNKEILGLRKNKGTLESKNKYIDNLVAEIKDKEKEIKELEYKNRVSRAEGYREGNRKGAESVEQMQAISVEKEINEITRVYKDALKNTERVLKEEQDLYTRLYKYIVKEGKVDIGEFRAPRGYTLDGIYEEITSKEKKEKEKEDEELMRIIYELRHGLGMEQKDIEQEMGISGVEYKRLYNKYKEKIEGMTPNE